MNVKVNNKIARANHHISVQIMTEPGSANFMQNSWPHLSPCGAGTNTIAGIGPVSLDFSNGTSDEAYAKYESWKIRESNNFLTYYFCNAINISLPLQDMIKQVRYSAGQRGPVGTFSLLLQICVNLVVLFNIL